MPPLTDQIDPHTQELLLAYIEDELRPDQQTQLDALLDAQPALRELLDAMRDDRGTLTALPFEAPPFELLDAAIERAERELLLGEPAPMESETHTLRFDQASVPSAPSAKSATPWRSYAAIAAVLTASTAVMWLALLPGDTARLAADYFVGFTESGATQKANEAQTLAAISPPPAPSASASAPASGPASRAKPGTPSSIDPASPEASAPAVALHEGAVSVLAESLMGNSLTDAASDAEPTSEFGRVESLEFFSLAAKVREADEATSPDTAGADGLLGAGAGGATSAAVDSDIVLGDVALRPLEEGSASAGSATLAQQSAQAGEPSLMTRSETPNRPSAEAAAPAEKSLGIAIAAIAAIAPEESNTPRQREHTQKPRPIASVVVADSLAVESPETITLTVAVDDPQLVRWAFLTAVGREPRPVAEGRGVMSIALDIRPHELPTLLAAAGTTEVQIAGGEPSPTSERASTKTSGQTGKAWTFDYADPLRRLVPRPGSVGLTLDRWREDIDPAGTETIRVILSKPIGEFNGNEDDKNDEDGDGDGDGDGDDNAE